MLKFHTNVGEFTITLDHEKAPETAANFLQYAKDGYFEGTLFHRIIPGFMAQGGGLEPGMVDKREGHRAPIKNEADNGLKNVRGSVAMARTMDPHSATSQFFVNLVDNSFLDHKSQTPQGWGYAVFGQVTEGMDVIDAMAKVETTSRRGHGDVPVEDILIERVEVIGE